MALTKPIQRRTVLAYIGTAAGGLLAGCTEPTGSPWRELSFRNIQIKKMDAEWHVNFELVKLARGPDEVEIFHDVRVHAYNRNRTEVCTKWIGTVKNSYPGGNGLLIEMDCTASPTMLTYSAAESPCDEEVVTIISIAIYDQDQGWLYDLHSRECGEGLPPEPRT